MQTLRTLVIPASLLALAIVPVVAGPVRHLPWFVFVGGMPGETSRAVVMGHAWIINAIVAEYVVRTRLAAPINITPGQPRSVLVSPV
jgi:hypothetical protein